jgi:peptidyl-prolyl cis-trans isomerase B (cyclophilin B)
MAQPAPLPPLSAPQKTNTLAIVGFILAFLMSFVGGILGIVALSQINKSAGVEGGKGLAIAAIIIGFIPILIIVVLSILGPVIGNVFSSINQGL